MQVNIPYISMDASWFHATWAEKKQQPCFFCPLKNNTTINDDRFSSGGVYRWPLRTQGLYGSIWDVLGRPIGLGNPHIFTYKTGWWVLEVFIIGTIYTKTSHGSVMGKKHKSPGNSFLVPEKSEWVSSRDLELKGWRTRWHPRESGMKKKVTNWITMV